MSTCELCGKDDAKFKTEIEGTLMNVCQACTKFGTVKSRTNVKIVVQEHKKPEIKEPTYLFLKGYGSILKNAREKMGLKQDELAKRLNERASTLHQIESEHFKPSIEVAKKLERELRIKLVEEIKDDSDNKMPDNPKRQNGPWTIGDMINIKRRK